jgi:hypothetical protein
MVAKGFSGEDPQGLSNRARELAGEFRGDGAYSLGRSLDNIAGSFEKLFTALTSSGAKESASTLETIAGAMNGIANAINKVAGAYENFQKFRKTGVGSLLFGNWGPNGMFPGLLNPTNPKGNAAGGSVMGNEITRVGEFGPELFVPNGVSGSIRKDNGGGGVVINLNGVVDAESARRSIERLLQNSTRRTGALDFAGSQL